MGILIDNEEDEQKTTLGLSSLTKYNTGTCLVLFSLVLCFITSIRFNIITAGVSEIIPASTLSLGMKWFVGTRVFCFICQFSPCSITNTFLQPHGQLYILVMTDPVDSCTETEC